MNDSAVLARCGHAAALAGIAQSAALVHDTAHGRAIQEDAWRALLHATFVTRPDSLDDVFPQLQFYQRGIRLADRMLAAPRATPIEPLKYALQLIDIEKQLRRRPGVVAQIGAGLEAIRDHRDPDDNDRTCGQLSELYQHTVSTLPRRVQVTGDPQQLSRDGVAAQVRALLFGGLRFAVLWHQLGGRRWHLVTRRSTIRHALAQLDQHIEANPLH